MQSLERRLGLFSVVTISISSMLGSGIFVLPGIGFTTTGPSLYLAFILSAITILPAAMSKAELATAMPTSGGTYVYIERTFGPLAGTVSGLGLFLSILLKASFALIGLGSYFAVFSSLPLLPTILVFLTIIIILNIFGVSKVSGFLTFVLGISVTSLIILSICASFSFEYKYLTPFMTNGWEGLASATSLVFVSFAGVTKVAAIAEEVKNPAKNLPRGILLSLLLVTLLYGMVSYTLGASFPSEVIAGDVKPIYTLAEKVGGHWVGLAMSLVAVLTMINTSNAGILAGSRFPFAMSRDKLLPSFLGKLHPIFLTPLMSILLSGVIVSLILITFDVAKIAKLASAFMILIYIIENITLVVLRETRPQWYKPGYKAPMYPLLQLLGIISGLVLLFAIGELAFMAILGIAIPGLLIFLFYSRTKTTRKGIIGIKGKRVDLIDELVLPAKHDNFFDVERKAQVVVTLFGREKSADMLVEMGTALAYNGDVEVARIIEVPEQTTLQDVSDEPPEVRSLRRRVWALANNMEKPIHFDTVVSHDVSRSIYEISQCVHCNWLLIEWRGRNRGALTIHNPIGWLKSHLYCDLAIFRDAGIRYIKKIFVLLNDDTNDKIIIETAEHLARVNSSSLTIVKFRHFATQEEIINKELLSLQGIHFDIQSAVEAKVLTGKNLVETVIAETVNYDLFILGKQNYSLKKSIMGADDDRLIAKAACSVLALHANIS